MWPILGQRVQEETDNVVIMRETIGEAIGAVVVHTKKASSTAPRLKQNLADMLEALTLRGMQKSHRDTQHQ